MVRPQMHLIAAGRLHAKAYIFTYGASYDLFGLSVLVRVSEWF